MLQTAQFTDLHANIPREQRGEKNILLPIITNLLVLCVWRQLLYQIMAARIVVSQRGQTQQSRALLCAQKDSAFLEPERARRHETPGLIGT